MEMLTTLHMVQGGDDYSINICGLTPNVGIVNVLPVQDTTTAVGEGEGRRESNLERRVIPITKQNYG